jgi:hypothetical protein
MSLKITGKTPSGKHLEKLKQSPNYKKNAFQNVQPPQEGEKVEEPEKR